MDSILYSKKTCPYFSYSEEQKITRSQVTLSWLFLLIYFLFFIAARLFFFLDLIILLCSWSRCVPNKLFDGSLEVTRVKTEMVDVWLDKNGGDNDEMVDVIVESGLTVMLLSSWSLERKPVFCCVGWKWILRCLVNGTVSLSTTSSSSVTRTGGGTFLEEYGSGSLLGVRGKDGRDLLFFFIRSLKPFLLGEISSLPSWKFGCCCLIS